MKIDEIPIQEYLKFEERIGVCGKCGKEYIRKASTTRCCLECRAITQRRYDINFYPKRKEVWKGTSFDPNEIFIPERFREDRWLSGLYILGKAIIFIAIVDATMDCQKIKRKYVREQKERIKFDAINFISGNHHFRRMDWLKELFDMAEVDLEDIRRRFKNEKKMVA